VGRREVLLGPALDGEGGGGGYEAGDSEGDQKAERDGEVRLASEGEGDGHDDGGGADLECGQLSGGNFVRGVSKREKVSGEGYGADEGEDVADAYAGEEILPCGPGWSGEEQEAREGQERSDGGGPSGGVGVGGAQDGDDGEQGDEDDDQAGDESGFGGGGAGEASGLKLVSGGEEEADDQPRDEGCAVNVSQVAVIDDDQRDGGEGHAEEIEEERGGVVESVLDEDEGDSPDGDDSQEEDVCEGRWA